MAAHQGPEPLFGTDGIRGPAGTFPLDRDTVTRLGRCVAESVVRGREGAGRRVVLGGDTRRSTPELCSWLAAGLAAGGAEAHFVGVLPTPGVSYLTASLNAGAGIAVSASHNPYPDNGIKLLDAAGRKWSPEAEAAIEARLRSSPADTAAGAEPGDLVADPADAERYLEALHAQIAIVGESSPLQGLRVVLDCAHGAASLHAPRLFKRLGAEVSVLFADPDGANINLDCGSTHPERLADTVHSVAASLGFAFDGDADRAIAVDEHGETRDGDALLFLWARHLLRSGHLSPARVVATSMSNLGLAQALAADGIELVRCDVGDRAVAQTMEAEGILLGGEQSGHIIHSGLAPTGDGLQTALHVAALVAASGGNLSDLLEGFRKYPQILLNVPVASKPDLSSHPAIAAAAQSVDQRLGDRGRLVLRYSGTEPLARVMIEGEDDGEIEDLARELADIIEKELAR
jgi:phosphoglucosamine mutase